MDVVSAVTIGIQFLAEVLATLLLIVAGFVGALYTVLSLILFMIDLFE